MELMMEPQNPETKKKAKIDKRQLAIVILCILTIGFAMTSILLAGKIEKTKKSQQTQTETSAVTDNYKPTSKEKKQIQSMQKAFPKVKVGMSEQEMLQAVGMDFNAKSKTKVSDVDCTQYDFVAAENRYGFSVLVTGGKVVGKGQTSLFAPNKKIKSTDIQTFGENVKYEDMVKKCGKGVLLTYSEIPGVDSQRIVLYGSKDSTLWTVIFNNDVCMSVNQVSPKVSAYCKADTESVGDVE